MTRAQQIRSALLGWYDAHRRELPWRSEKPDPYRVWLSEIMLQQTTVPHATPYFLQFTRRWPTVSDLAASRDEDVMAAWAGLGYYARARNLLACARAVANDHEGVFPETEAGLLELPGVGPYTAAAIAAIAFGRPANVVDGNVERVMARLFRVETALPDAKPELKALAADLVTGERPGDWAQALMDLGATVCRPKSPLCDRCPLSAWCEAFEAGDPANYPRRAPKAERPRRYGHVWVMRDGDHVAVVRRPPKGLLGGMLGLPTSDWTNAPQDAPNPVPANWRTIGQVEHVFTHFALTLDVHVAEEGTWSGEWTNDPSALPSVFLKAVRRANSNAS